MFRFGKSIKVFSIVFAMLMMFTAGVALEAAPDSHDECSHVDCVCLGCIFVALAPDTELFDIGTIGSLLISSSSLYREFVSNDIFHPPVC